MVVLLLGFWKQTGTTSLIKLKEILPKIKNRSHLLLRHFWQAIRSLVVEREELIDFLLIFRIEDKESFFIDLQLDWPELWNFQPEDVYYELLLRN